MKTATKYIMILSLIEVYGNELTLEVYGNELTLEVEKDRQLEAITMKPDVERHSTQLQFISCQGK